MDFHQVRTGNEPHALAILRNLVISLLRLTDPTETSLVTALPLPAPA